jgi:hypothetical protein
MSQPTTLATGQINRSDQLSVELHTPAAEPAFVLVRWPAGPSVASADDDSFDRLVAAVYRTLSTARVALARMRGDRRTR